LEIAPASITDLRFANGFDDVLNPGMLPAHMKRLAFVGCYRHPIVKDALPSGLQELTISMQNIANTVLPNNLKKLDAIFFFDDEIPHDVLSRFLPNSLTRLSLWSWANNVTLQPGTLPQNLTALHCGYRYNRTLQKNVLPQSLLMLNCGYSFDRTIAAGVLPSSLTCLHCFTTAQHFERDALKGTNLRIIHIGSSSRCNLHCELLLPLNYDTVALRHIARFTLCDDCCSTRWQD
jgi:hypothetical protein